MNPDNEKIRRWREERGWSQEHLAEVAGIGLRTVQRIENGDKASRESAMALAAAFQVDVAALAVDARSEAVKQLRERTARSTAALRLSFWIHLASYACGVLVFTGISVGLGSGFVMRWPLIWWMVAVACHGLTVVIVELVTRYQQRGLA